MTRRLTKLKINEVSLVSEAASPGARVMIYKMCDRPPQRNRFHEIFSRIDFSKVKIAAPPPDDDDDEIDEIDEIDESNDANETDDDTTALHPKLEEMIAALQAANSSLSRAVAVYFLLHNPHGQAMARHLAEITKTRKEIPMEHIDQLKEFAKQHGGMTAVAKHILAKGTTALTEHEFTEMMMEHAKVNKIAGESDAAAFSRIFSSSDAVDIRRAHAITKSTPTNVVNLKPAQVSHNDVSDTDSAPAYQQLVDKAVELRRHSPTLSEAQSFAKAFESNPELASRAHRRPTPDALNQFPR